LRCMSSMNPVFTVSDTICPSPACKLHPLPAFAVRTAFPSSDYYAGSVPATRAHRSLRSSVHGGTEARVGSQVPPLPFVRCRSRLCPVWNQAAGPCRLSRPLTSGRPDVPDPQTRNCGSALHKSCDSSPTSELVRHLLTGLRPSVRFPSPLRSRWPGRSGIGSPRTPGFNGFC
jgi:hypothetical protein